MIDRSANRARIKATLDRQARAKGFADYTAELDADFEAWQARHTQTGAEYAAMMSTQADTLTARR